MPTLRVNSGARLVTRWQIGGVLKTIPGAFTHTANHHGDALINELSA